MQYRCRYCGKASETLSFIFSGKATGQSTHLNSQTCSRNWTTNAIHKNDRIIKIQEPNKNTTRLILCSRGNVTSPEGRYDAIGETKSAMGPVVIRDIVFENERSLT